MAKDVNELTTVEFKNLLGLTDEAIQADIEAEKQRKLLETKSKPLISTTNIELDSIKDTAKRYGFYFINKSGKIDKQLLIRWIREHFAEFETDFSEIIKTPRVWNGKYFEVATQQNIENYFQGFFESYEIDLLTYHRKEIYWFTKTQDVKPRKLNREYDKKIAIPFPNGTFYIYNEGKSNEFIPDKWERKDGLIYMLDMDYSPDLLTLDWTDSVIGEYFRDYFTPEGIEAVQTYLGCCLTPSIYTKKQLCMIGDGNNGKGVLCRVFESLFDESAVSAVPQKSWGSKHENMTMLTSIVNIASEPEGYTFGSDIFKQITGRDSVTWNPKHKDTMDAPCIANHIFTANHPPKIPVDKAVLARLLLVPVNDGVSDTEATDKFELKFERNRKYLMAFVLQGLMKFIKGGHRLPASDPILLDEFLRANESTLMDYIADCIEFTKNGKEASKTLYQCYVAWVKNYKPDKQILTQDTFYRKLPALFTGRDVKKLTVSLRGDKVAGYKGLRIKDNLGFSFYR